MCEIDEFLSEQYWSEFFSFVKAISVQKQINRFILFIAWLNFNSFYMIEQIVMTETVLTWSILIFISNIQIVDETTKKNNVWIFHRIHLSVNIKIVDYWQNIRLIYILLMFMSVFPFNYALIVQELFLQYSLFIVVLLLNDLIKLSFMVYDWSLYPS